MLVVLVGGVAGWRFVHSPDGSPSQLAYAGGPTVYTVVPGDSLSAIARRFGVPVGDLIALNHIANPDVIVAGAQLRIPTTLGNAGGYDPQGVRELISSYAQQFGVPSAFALAIAWQESGFNQRMVSSTGAIGVMQVEPATGVTIENMLGRAVDLHAVSDNVQAGVYWLSQLLRQYNGDRQMAAAAYYQGPKALARDGMYDDTKQYVRDVIALQSRFGG